MRYGEIVQGTFLKRPNRFIAHVDVEGVEHVVHVKNTGRCKELLIPGTQVVLEKAANPNRKTAYDLVAVYKGSAPEENGGTGRKDFLINLDSQAPNKVVGEWLAGQGFDLVKPEHVYGNSRVDFYMEQGRQRYLMEVKGCTLEVDGVGYFPDAPTERGVKHLHELTAAVAEGYRCAICFAIQMPGIAEVRPNIATHPEFDVALGEAQAAGVKVIFLRCAVTPDTLVAEAGQDFPF